MPVAIVYRFRDRDLDHGGQRRSSTCRRWMRSGEDGQGTRGGSPAERTSRCSCWDERASDRRKEGSRRRGGCALLFGGQQGQELEWNAKASGGQPSRFRMRGIGARHASRRPREEGSREWGGGGGNDSGKGGGKLGLAVGAVNYVNWWAEGQRNVFRDDCRRGLVRATDVLGWDQGPAPPYAGQASGVRGKGLRGEGWRAKPPRRSD